MSIPITYIEQKLQAIVAPKLRVAPEQVPLDKSLLEDLNLDSFDLMTVILEIEEAFTPVTISDKSAEELLTLRELATYIDKEMSLAPTPANGPTPPPGDHKGPLPFRAKGQDTMGKPTPPPGDHKGPIPSSAGDKKGDHKGPIPSSASTPAPTVRTAKED